MTRSTTAMFIGHSRCYDITSEMVIPHVERLIGSGFTDFLNGGMGDFDRICAYAVHRLKERYPFITNNLVIPYLTFKNDYPDLYDRTIYPEGLETCYFKRIIPERNRYMVENSACAVCYVKNTWGGAVKTYGLAKRKGVTIIDIE